MKAFKSKLNGTTGSVTNASWLFKMSFVSELVKVKKLTDLDGQVMLTIKWGFKLKRNDDGSVDITLMKKEGDQ